MSSWEQETPETPAPDEGTTPDEGGDEGGGGGDDGGGEPADAPA